LKGAALATVSTAEITNISITTALGGGYVIDEGGAPVTARGVCWSTTGWPDVSNNKTFNGAGRGSFTSSITGLTKGTTYFIRAYATNSAGTSYGKRVSFMANQLETGSFTDIRDNHIYKTVKIGDQNWMAENLAFLTAVSPSSAGSGTSPHYYVYGYEGNSVAEAMIFDTYPTYGVLYNWPAAKTACPAGWHLPSLSEWNWLINYLGISVAGKMKEIGTAHWSTPNTAATNSSGFTALPGGYRGEQGGFFNLSYWADFWTSTEDDTLRAFEKWLTAFNADIQPGSGIKSIGFSVRCLKD
jgi:uncharacterized protein (TIGR02145 family)